MVVGHGIEVIQGKGPSYCPPCVWIALIVSLGIHAAIASVYWTAETHQQVEPGAPVLMLELAAFGHSSAAEPARAVAVTGAQTPPALAPVQTTAREQPSVASRPVAKTTPKPVRKAVRRPDPPSSTHPEVVTRRAAVRPTQPARAAAPEPSAPRAGAVERTPGANPGSATAAAAGAVRASAERAYLDGLRRAIAQAQRYPAESRRRAESGVATVSFVIAADGGIGGIRLAGGSGFALLDQAAIEALRRLGRYQPIPSALGRRSWALRVPIRFDLRD